ncbi:MAG: type II toxin-antitoxin system RelE/ParE family toxin [Pyrinomonadaceae bacterium]
MKVRWTESALTQLQAIHDYLAQTSPEYALRIVDRLTKRSIQIAAFPFSGRMVPEYEVNEVREVIEVPYRMIYLIVEATDQLDVLAIIHTSREGRQLLE